MRILDQKQEALLNEERKLLNDLRVALAQFGATPEDHETLGESIQQLDELFLLVVVGEFNSGKSAFINALLGKDILEEGVTPTTTQINVLRYGEERTRIVESENLHTLSADVELLADISIVDTPGTNAIIREHEAITSQFVPRSDLVLFITSADRPFTESERIFLERICEWGKKIIVVLNKIDLFETDKELAQVQSFITENAQALFGMTPEIFAVSARLALRAKQGEPALWLDSRFEPLEDYIREKLDEEERLRLKFFSPLGVGRHLANKYLAVIDSRLDVLKADFDTIKDVEAQLDLYKEDMYRDFNFRVADLDNVLLEMEQRGQEYFDETLRLTKVFDLLNKKRIEEEFEQIVVGDTPQQVEKKTNELIDWLVDSQLRQWQAVTEHLAERRYQHKDRIIGDAGGGSFHYDREHLIESVGRDSQRVVENYDKESEAEALADGARNAVAALAAVEVGALGLGTLVAILATTAAADVTGIILASLMAALGLFIIPAKRRRAKQEMREKIADMREQLVTSLRTQFESEIERSIQKINEAISPYTRFVRAEHSKLLEDQTTFTEIKTGLSRLEVRVDEVSKPAEIERE
jgi:small GTP-binding protein